MPREPRLEGLANVSPEMLVSLIGMLRWSGLVTSDEVEEFARALKSRNGFSEVANALMAV